MENIYLVEDDDNIRKLVCYALTREGYNTVGFALPSEFYAEYRNKKADLILLDIMLPEEDGLTILEKIRADDKFIPVIMLTAKDSEFDKVTGLDMGADDYIAKPFGMTELVSRIRAVLRRARIISENRIYKIGTLELDTEKHTVTVDENEINLSFKEYSILKILLEADGKAVTRETLFSKVWGEYYGESRTLDVHIKNLRTKLGTAGKYIHTIKNVGYRLSGDENA
ncbi:MAG: response regulator transcription factor [Ruminococcus flavefaciens]|nr:response regulator transcription factor [Ruminococcus flavefaciens]